MKNSDTSHLVFISHSSKDKALAKEVSEYLNELEIPNWISTRDIDAGKSWSREIVGGINKCTHFVLLYSKNCGKSKHVLREVNLADGLDNKTIPVNIDGSTVNEEFWYYLNTEQWLELDLSKKSDRYAPLAQVILDSPTQSEFKQQRSFFKFSKWGLTTASAIVIAITSAFLIGLRDRKDNFIDSDTPISSKINNTRNGIWGTMWQGTASHVAGAVLVTFKLPEKQNGEALLIVRGEKYKIDRFVGPVAFKDEQLKFESGQITLSMNFRDLNNPSGIMTGSDGGNKRFDFVQITQTLTRK